MKFKYYLRGLGIGIFVSTVILSVSFALKKPAMSDEEVIARAEELGMILPEEEKDVIPTEQTDETDTEDETVQPEDTKQPEGETVITQTEFTVEVGESSNQVAQKLAELGLVDDAEAFNQYMVEQNYDSYVLPGTVVIPQGADYEQIAQLLTDKTLER